MGNSDFCQTVAGMPKGGSRLNTRAVAIVCDSVYLSKPSGPCRRPTPERPIPPIGALRLPQANAYPSSTFTVPDRSRAAILWPSAVEPAQTLALSP